MKHKIKNIPLFLSGAVLICLAIPAKTTWLMLGAGCAAALLILLQVTEHRTVREIMMEATAFDKIAAAAVWAVLAALFVFKWRASSMVAGIAAVIHLTAVSFLAIAALCSVVSLPILLFSVGVLRKYVFGAPTFYEPAPDDKKSVLTKSTVIFILVLSIGVVTLCSTCSPLYPINETSCFFTVGKSMLHGLVPYRDLFEQKGPFLYMIYAVAALISETTYWGAWIIEIIGCFIFTCFSYKTVRLFCGEKSLPIVFAIVTVIYTQTSFNQGGLAEELCFPLLSYGLYVGMKAIKNETMPTYLECFLIGVTSACVFWIKFTLVGFYVGWFIVPAVLLIYEHKWKRLGGTILTIAGGVIALSIPILIYFAANGALLDLFEVYFYDNLFLYGNGSESGVMVRIEALYLSLESMVIASPIVTVLIIVSIFWAWSEGHQRLVLSLICMVTTAFIFAYVGTSMRFGYYSLLFSVFAPMAAPAIYSVIRSVFGIPRLKNFRKRFSNARELMQRGTAATAVVCLILAGILTPNRSMMFKSREETVQYQFAEVINTVDDATLLVYQVLDYGFYTAANVVPNCRYFCTVNARPEDMIETQLSYMENEEVDFVIVRNFELDTENYECVAECTYYFEGTDYTYHLYELKSLLQGE